MVGVDGVLQTGRAEPQAIDWWEASAGEAVGQGAHAEEALRMLERACGLADVLADYYRNNQQACYHLVRALCVCLHLAHLCLHSAATLSSSNIGSIICLRHSVLAAQVSLWLLNRRRTAEREGSEVAAATLAGTTSRAPSSADQRVTDASATVAASAAGVSVHCCMMLLNLSLHLSARRTGHCRRVSQACSSSTNRRWPASEH